MTNCNNWAYWELDMQYCPWIFNCTNQTNNVQKTTCKDSGGLCKTLTAYSGTHTNVNIFSRDWLISVSKNPLYTFQPLTIERKKKKASNIFNNKVAQLHSLSNWLDQRCLYLICLSFPLISRYINFKYQNTLNTVFKLKWMITIIYPCT